jgi:hypothetical protein
MCEIFAYDANWVMLACTNTVSAMDIAGVYLLS